VNARSTSGSATHHPTVLRHERERASHAQLRAADAVTAFAGSMAFVYVHALASVGCQRAKADHDFVEEEMELHTNTELTRQIHALTTELHQRLLEGDDHQGPLQ
jgi:hypothetical protein